MINKNKQQFVRTINGKNYISIFHLMQVQSIVKYGSVEDKLKLSEDLRGMYGIDYFKKDLNVETGEIICCYFAFH